MSVMVQIEAVMVRGSFQIKSISLQSRLEMAESAVVASCSGTTQHPIQSVKLPYPADMHITWKHKI
jgi:hypothetical protein